MANLILLEDEPILRAELADFLTEHGYAVESAASIAEFHQRFLPQTHSVAVIDIGLPDGNGLELVAELRSRDLNLGIVILTARGATTDRIDGLAHGADYHLPKTSDLNELAAVIGALVRRLHRGGVSTCWILDRGRRQLIPPGLQALDLSPQDFLVLKAIMEGTGNPVSKKAIVAALGEDYVQYDLRRIDTQISRLRRRTHQETGVALPLRTFRLEGYLFSAPVELR